MSMMIVDDHAGVRTQGPTVALHPSSKKKL